MPEHAKQTGCDTVEPGLYRNGVAENYIPAYDMVDVDYQIIHASRGCFRRCNFCGTWKVEPLVSFKKTIQPEIKKKKLIFYDNNLLANPHIKNILGELAEFRFPNRCTVECEGQSGLDGRLLTSDPGIAVLLKKAHFKNPRIAWDGPYLMWPQIKEQIFSLRTAGFSSDNIFVFMLYNHRLSYDEMRAKLDACRRWGVRVIDCRFRPLNSIQDGYRPRAKGQKATDYFVHENWTDRQVRTFRRAVRRQNIAIMLGLPNGRYLDGIEEKYIQV